MGKYNSKKFLAPIIILAGVVLVGIGITNGEVQTVFQKAILICWGCIGLG